MCKVSFASLHLTKGHRGICGGSESGVDNRKVPERNSPVLTKETVRFIQRCLQEDEDEGLKKQKHTAKRIYDRLVEEQGFSGAESTVRNKVKELKGEIPKAFVPLQFDPGDTLQVDWGEATVYVADTRMNINIFCARLCYSYAD